MKVLDRIQIDDVKIVKVNVENFVELTSQQNIQSVPTLVFYKNGEQVDADVGVSTQTELTSKIGSLLKKAKNDK